MINFNRWVFSSHRLREDLLCISNIPILALSKRRMMILSLTASFAHVGSQILGLRYDGFCNDLFACCRIADQF
jgi:hypothetical protein